MTEQTSVEGGQGVGGRDSIRGGGGSGGAPGGTHLREEDAHRWDSLYHLRHVHVCRSAFSHGKATLSPTQINSKA